ncbi:M20/M25/M40 family metallo-hydrolase [Phenylobacterium sp.]|uniref:M20/M25/M40 family metallo-hydrolase n=1 Tax=Phenylobacterium sp. TaxID=1871053 RepID=UPI00286BBFB3|nr:M20/M25/M40 family metallo-hydrolase [Phenylobacterium sp.]
MAAIVACGLSAGPAHAAGEKALQDVEILSTDAMAGRAAGSPGSALARAHILKRFSEIGLKPAYGGFEQPFAITLGTEARRGTNLVGQIAGTGASDKVLVITAHYDHLGVRKGEIYNGADDNASGVAALLAAAESFAKSPPKHTVIFAAVDAEELGHRGSGAFVAAPPVPLARIALNLNLDMLSKNAKGELYASGTYHFPWLKPRLAALAGQVPVTLKQGHDGPPWRGDDDWTLLSDHAAFHKAGVPWVYLGVEDHPEYHRPTDDFATVPRAFFAKAVTTVVIVARGFDDDLDAMAKEAGR